MRQKAIYVVDLIKQVVTDTNTAVIAELKAYNALIQAINFVPGTEGEINEVLTLMSQQGSTDGKQWPLFALLFSFREQHGQIVGVDNTADLNIIIARRGNNTDKTPARYNNNFRPVLYPIYLEFLNQLYLSPVFITNTPDYIPHEKWDFPYYNAERDTNVFNSYVDAIQVKIKLKINVQAAWKCVA